LIALSIDKKVEFVGIIDGNGKLLAGEYRQNVMNSYLIKSNLFYSAILIPAIKICKRKTRKTSCSRLETRVDDSNNDDHKINFEIIGLDNIKLAITPLTKINEKYLCVYIGSAESYQKIISKISDNI
jgi:hypothetical protein